MPDEKLDLLKGHDLLALHPASRPCCTRRPRLHRHWRHAEAFQPSRRCRASLRLGSEPMCGCPWIQRSRLVRPTSRTARLRPGVSFQAAEADVKRVATEIAAERPRTHRAYTARLFALRETVIHDIRPTLLLLFAAAGLLFLITCANAAGLLLARSVARVRETAMRVALGASRGQLAAHYLAEGVLISLVGAAGGVLLALTITPAIVSLAANYLPRAEEVSLDSTVLLFALAAAGIASVLSSLAPLRQAVRTAPIEVLGEGVRASAGRRGRRASQSLVVCRDRPRLFTVGGQFHADHTPEEPLARSARLRGRASADVHSQPARHHRG